MLNDRAGVGHLFSVFRIFFFALIGQLVPQK